MPVVDASEDTTSVDQGRSRSEESSDTVPATCPQPRGEPIGITSEVVDGSHHAKADPVEHRGGHVMPQKDLELLA